MAAEIGDHIVWGDPDDPVIFRVGPGNELRQLIDGLTREEWTLREQQSRIAEVIEEFNHLPAPWLENRVSEAAAEVSSAAGILFDAEEWLDEGKLKKGG